MGIERNEEKLKRWGRNKREGKEIKEVRRSENKFVQTKMRLKEGTKIELPREISHICQILPYLSDLQVC